MSSSDEHAARFAEWISTHRGIVFKVVRSFAESDADAADLRQEMLLQLWISISSYSSQSKPSTWVYKICLNTALTWRRAALRRERRIESVATLASLEPPAGSPAEDASQRELIDQLYRAIHAMPEADRALVLLLLDGLAYREIADITGLTENHVGVALTRARRRLAATLKGVNDELE